MVATLKRTGARLNIEIKQGSDFNPSPFTVYSDAAQTTLVNLTGFTARMQGRQSFASTTTVFDLTTENGGLTLGGAAGTIQPFIADTVTAAITITQGVYDLELIDASGLVEEYLFGVFFVKKEATK